MSSICRENGNVAKCQAKHCQEYLFLIAGCITTTRFEQYLYQLLGESDEFLRRNICEQPSFIDKRKVLYIVGC